MIGILTDIRYFYIIQFRCQFLSPLFYFLLKDFHAWAAFFWKISIIAENINSVST